MALWGSTLAVDRSFTDCSHYAGGYILSKWGPFALTNSPLLGMTTIKPSSVALQIDSYYTHRDEDMLLCFHARELVPMAVKK